jgi:hypothetical protein
LHKTPTTVFVPQLFDARLLASGATQLILHDLSGEQRRNLSEMAFGVEVQLFSIQLVKYRFIFEIRAVHAADLHRF